MGNEPVYVPILKGKMFDLMAVQKLEPAVRALVKPLVEALPVHKGKTIEDHIHTVCHYLRKYAPDGPLFVDFRGIDPEATVSSGHNAIVYGYRLLRALDRPVTPVYGLARNDAIWNDLGKQAKYFGAGFCFRLVSDDLEPFSIDDTWEQVTERVAQMTVPLEETDLLLDFRALEDHKLQAYHEQVVSFLSANALSPSFRSVIVSGSCALKDVSSVEKEGTQDVLRHELTLWRKLWLDLPENLRPIYSDYGIVHPDFIDLGPNPNINAKIRYTAGDRIRYFRGHGLHRPVSDYVQYRGLAAKVRSNSLYAGPTESFGDGYIEACATSATPTPGAPSTWVRADMNRHMTTTARQIEHELVALSNVVATT